VADLVWQRFGAVQNYVEPFFGSGAVLLNRPQPFVGSETVNDRDGFVANFWRALAADPEQVAAYADWPVNENDQHARHYWLIQQRATLTARLEGDPTYYDAKIAGWWVWGICVWIGGGWCSGDGPWQADETGQLVHLGDQGRGVYRRRVHLGNQGRGVHRQLVHLDRGRGVHRKRVDLIAYFEQLADRLRGVRVCCGDWARVCRPTPTVKLGLTGVLLDPPYSRESDRTDKIYAVDDLDVAHAVLEWCRAWEDDPRMRIALCGYEGEHDLPGWAEVAWKAHGGYGSQGEGRGRTNAGRERIWFSPHCLMGEQPMLWDESTQAIVT
jgi:hypothetical protein